MNKSSAYLKLIRPINIVITFASVLVGGIISINKFYLPDTLIFTAIAVSLAFSAGNIINDYYDIEIDKINKPERILARGIISPPDGLLFYLIVLSLSLGFSFIAEDKIFYLNVAVCILLYLYSFKLKNLIFISNVLVAFIVALAFVFGSMAVDKFYPSIIPFTFAFLINLVREIVKDMEDEKGDSAKGLNTLPIKYGINFSKTVITICLAILIIATIVPYAIGYYNVYYFIIVLLFVDPALIYILIKLKAAFTEEHFHRVSAQLKLSMILGLIAIFLGR